MVKLLQTNLGFIQEEIITLIPNQYAKVSALEVLTRLSDTVAVMVDDNLDNKNQLVQIWGTFSSDPEMVNVFNGLLSEAVGKIKDEKIASALLLLQKPLVQTVIALTDTSNADNEAQLKSIWLDFVNSSEFLKFVISNLDWIVSKIVKNERIKNTILNLLALFIKP